MPMVLLKILNGPKITYKYSFQLDYVLEVPWKVPLQQWVEATVKVIIIISIVYMCNEVKWIFPGGLV